MDKKGNKVGVITTNNGVAFRDVTKLLAPSTNLRSFGQLFNLKQEKAHFPFSMLNSVRALSISDFPHDLKMWKSDLSGAGPSITRADVLEAKRLYDEAGCANLGDYLKAYLRLDVVILYRATQEWRGLLKKLIGIDFIECKKYTISSLSNLAGGKSREKNLCLGTFFPNNSQSYRLLRLGLRG